MKCVAAVLILLAAAGCGGSDDTAEPGDTASTTTTEASGADCTTDLAFTNRTTGESVEVTSTAAVSLQDGAAYTAYAADFEVESDDVSMVSAPEAPPGNHLITLAITVFNPDGTPAPVEAGTQIDYTDEFGVLTFVVLHSTSEETYGNNTGAGGSVLVREVGDRFCAEIEYADDEKELRGTLAADVNAL